MLRTKKQGFTLIELMVVVVIIGVLASLAIPRFGQASARSKVAEAPRVIASWESAFLASAVESRDPGALTADEAIFEIPNSQWFDYAFGEDTPASFSAAASAGIGGGVEEGNTLSSTFNNENTNNPCFNRAFEGAKLGQMAGEPFREGGGC